MRYFAFILSISIVTTSAFASAPKAYIDIETGFFSAPYLVVDGKTVKPGFFGYSNLEQTFASNPAAANIAKEYNSYRYWGAGLVVGGLVAALAYSWSVSHEEYSEGKYWEIFLVGFIPGTIVLQRAQTTLIRAVNQYNGVYAASTTGFFSPSIAVDGTPMVGWNWQF